MYLRASTRESSDAPNSHSRLQVEDKTAGRRLLC